MVFVSTGKEIGRRRRRRLAMQRSQYDGHWTNNRANCFTDIYGIHSIYVCMKSTAIMVSYDLFLFCAIKCAPVCSNYQLKSA